MLGDVVGKGRQKHEFNQPGRNTCSSRVEVPVAWRRAVEDYDSNDFAEWMTRRVIRGEGIEQSMRFTLTEAEGSQWAAEVTA